MEKKRRRKEVGEAGLNIGDRKKITEIQNCGRLCGCVMLMSSMLGRWVNRQQWTMEKYKSQDCM